jgi:hypothetical protein
MDCFVPSAARAGASGRAAGVLLLAVLMLAAVPGCTKSHHGAAGKAGATPPASPSPASTAAPTAHFSTQGVRAVDAQDRPSVNPAANAAAKQVINLVDTYYNTAFLQPSQWGGGSFPSLSSLFTPDAGASVPANLQALSLGPLAPQIARVNPSTESTNVVDVLIEANGSPSYATVTTRFQATTVPTGSAASVTILQSAQFMVDTSDYKIAGYDVTTSFSGQSASASYSPAPGTA